MKSYLFTTETDRGGVMLCDINDFDTAVAYLCKRFDGVVKIESAEQVWQRPEAPQKDVAQIATASESSAVVVADKGNVAATDTPNADSADLFG
ncbi:hypothetical protein [Amphritea sp.]|uniref:hypothetical protein n=1 Tax=Amphritea sp. TaxID=1872502 RepID=UPI003A8E8F24